MRASSLLAGLGTLACTYDLGRRLWTPRAGLWAAIGVLATTLPRTPYAADVSAAAAGVDRIIYVAARQFEFIWSDEPIVRAEDVGRVPRLHQVAIAPGATVEIKGFRTSYDAVAAFKFSSVSQSYAQTRHGDTRNVGVIGLAAYLEKGTDPWTWMPEEIDQRNTANPFATAR